MRFRVLVEGNQYIFQAEGHEPLGSTEAFSDPHLHVFRPCLAPTHNESGLPLCDQYNLAELRAYDFFTSQFIYSGGIQLSYCRRLDYGTPKCASLAYGLF